MILIISPHMFTTLCLYMDGNIYNMLLISFLEISLCVM